MEMKTWQIALIWPISTLLEKFIKKSKGGVDVEGVWDSKDKETVG